MYNRRIYLLHQILLIYTIDTIYLSTHIETLRLHCIHAYISSVYHNTWEYTEYIQSINHAVYLYTIYLLICIHIHNMYKLYILQYRALLQIELVVPITSLNSLTFVARRCSTDYSRSLQRIWRPCHL